MDTRQMQQVTAVTGMDDAVVRRITSELAEVVQPAPVDVGAILELHDWVRANSPADGATPDLQSMVERWHEYSRTQSGDDWIMRAFGD